MTETTQAQAAASLIDQLRDFAAGLGAEERELLAALLAPGIDAAWADEADESGLGVSWTPSALSEHLVAAIRDRNLRVEGW
ncbi:MAG: hypothetical protein R2754_10175 [Microthrixaceae bacterium]